MNEITGGLQLAEQFFHTYGEPMLRDEFPELLPYLAAGLAGSGSECFGFDDEVSRDHDYEPGFCIWIGEEAVVDSRAEFKLERAYAHLPMEYSGIKRSLLSPVGGSRHGVIRASAFFVSKCGSPDGILTSEQWLAVPEASLSEAVNGKVFLDEGGWMRDIRNRLAYYPAEIRRKKMAGYLLLMNQAGQYNYERCLQRGETGAAQFAVHTFVDACMHVIFTLNRKYMPYYKWSFRAMRELELLGDLSDTLEFLISSDNSERNAVLKVEMIADLVSLVIGELQKQELTEAICQDLEKHAYSVNDGIADATLRNMHILAGV